MFNLIDIFFTSFSVIVNSRFLRSIFLSIVRLGSETIQRQGFVHASLGHRAKVNKFKDVPSAY